MKPFKQMIIVFPSEITSLKSKNEQGFNQSIKVKFKNNEKLSKKTLIRKNLTEQEYINHPKGNLKKERIKKPDKSRVFKNI